MKRVSRDVLTKAPFIEKSFNQIFQKEKNN